MTMPSRFQKRTVLVSGAGHGIGRQIALDFAAEGARVGVNDVDGERASAVVREIAGAGGSSLALVADVRSAAQIERIMQELSAQFGAPDIVVNNAGVYPNSLIVDMSEEEWDRVWDINMKGMFFAQSRGAAADDRPQVRRENHQHELDRVHPRAGRRFALLLLQGGDLDVHASAGSGSGPAQYSSQRGGAGLGRGAGLGLGSSLY